MEEWYSLEKKIIAIEVSSYMRENDVTLEQAYEDMIIPEDMKMTEDEIEEITSKYKP